MRIHTQEFSNFNPDCMGSSKIKKKNIIKFQIWNPITRNQGPITRNFIGDTYYYCFGCF